jgi:Protein of unknown function (DUF1592)/Protein of unknown function (DUF1588)/Protein of unknown function (DUF1595)/Protein of unknown function (DUF1587)/Protein of unknown function (DUF1585)
MHGVVVSQPAQRHSSSTPSTRSPRAHAAWLLLALSLSACSGSIKDPGQLGQPTAASDPNRPALAANGGSRATPGASSAGKGSAAAAGSGSTSGTSCTTVGAAPAPLARLTNLEYRNTLSALLPGITMPAVDLPADNVVEGFDNNAKAQTPSPSLIGQYRASAQAVAGAVTANMDAALPCHATASADQDSCGAQFIDSFVARAYRRPLATDERTRMLALFSAAKTSYDYPTAIGMVVQATLQAPQFLYRVELGGVAKAGVAPLSGYEVASRLSYFFWDTMPDQALLAAAKSGQLDTAAGIETQARRLLADPQAHAAVSNLFHQWLRFDKMDSMPKSSALFPSWNDQVANSLRSSASEFTDHVFWDLKGSLHSLLTDNQTYVDANIAAIYGLAAAAISGTTGMTLTTTDKTQRSGILTQAGLMAAFAHETADSPVLRGVFVMDRLLCSAPPPPPPGVTGSITNSSSGSQPMTTRDSFAMTHEQGDCATCHHFIDGFGFGFEHYDAVGQWRDKDNGLAVDATGWIAGTRDADGPYNGAVELGQKLAASMQVSDCVSSQWFRYSLGLGAADVESCDIAPVSQAFANTGGNMQELMIATVTSDAFRNRPEVKP